MVILISWKIVACLWSPCEHTERMNFGYWKDIWSVRVCVPLPLQLNWLNLASTLYVECKKNPHQTHLWPQFFWSNWLQVSLETKTAVSLGNISYQKTYVKAGSQNTSLWGASLRATFNTFHFCGYKLWRRCRKLPCLLKELSMTRSPAGLLAIKKAPVYQSSPSWAHLK